jgi:flavin-dependent dehydrogenase
LIPGCFHNHGNYVISLGAFTKWLGEQAEGLGVEIFPGFTAAEVLYTEANQVRGVATGNQGIGKDGQPHGGFQLGMELLGKYTVFAEGARGHLGSAITNWIRAATRKVMRWASRNSGKLTRPRPNRGWWCTPRVGRWMSTPMAAASSTTWKAIR